MSELLEEIDANKYRIYGNENWKIVNSFLLQNGFHQHGVYRVTKNSNIANFTDIVDMWSKIVNNELNFKELLDDVNLCVVNWDFYSSYVCEYKYSFNVGFDELRYRINRDFKQVKKVTINNYTTTLTATDDDRFITFPFVYYSGFNYVVPFMQIYSGYKINDSRFQRNRSCELLHRFNSKTNAKEILSGRI